MNPDELRRLAQSKPERQRQASVDAQLIAGKRRHEDLWKQAHQAVATLETTVSNAANRGEFDVIIFMVKGTTYDCATNRQFLSIVKTRMVSGGWFKEKTAVVEIINVPEFAQFVFNECPPSLKPQWVGVNNEKFVSMAAAQHSESGRQPDVGILLKVSW